MTTTELLDDITAIRVALKDGRVFSARVTKADGQRTTAVVSDSTTDRMGDRVDPDGWMLDNYRKNPVVLWSHSYEILPVGKCESIAVVDGKLVATTRWEDHPQAQQIAKLYATGTLSSFSVGFKPHAYKPIKNASGDVTGIHFTRVELLEYSAVAVPANPSATVLRSMDYQTVTKRVQRWSASVDDDPDVKDMLLRKAVGEVSIERGPGFSILRYHDHNGDERYVITYE